MLLINEYMMNLVCLLNPNGFEKTEAGGQKFLKHLHELNTKLHGKHWLYTVLANRFNVC